MRLGRSNNNAIQMSYAENRSVAPISPAPNLNAKARQIIESMRSTPGAAVEGTCQMGRFCKVEIQTERLVYGEVWVVTDEINFAIVTFCCDARPSSEELTEVAAMVESIVWSPPVDQLAS
jgi:hypothetical protein